MHKLEDIKLAIIGLGYVGLPLAVEFGKQRPVIGFDINQSRINALREGHDSTLEVSDQELKQACLLSYSADTADLEIREGVDRQTGEVSVNPYPSNMVKPVA